MTASGAARPCRPRRPGRLEADAVVLATRPDAVAATRGRLARAGATTTRVRLAGVRGRASGRPRRSRSGGCGSTGTVAHGRPAVPRHERLRPARQRLGARPVRGRAPRGGARPHDGSRRRAARLRPARRHRRGATCASSCSPRCTGSHPETAARERRARRVARRAPTARWSGSSRGGRAPACARPTRGCSSPATRCAATYPVALMERAATTGWLAADQLLSGWGQRGHDVWSVPMRVAARPASPAGAPRHPGLPGQERTQKLGRHARIGACAANFCVPLTWRRRPGAARRAGPRSAGRRPTAGWPTRACRP